MLTSIDGKTIDSSPVSLSDGRLVSAAQLIVASATPPPAPVPFRTEHLLGVVVNWPTVGLTDDFARRAGLYAEYRLTGG